MGPWSTIAATATASRLLSGGLSQLGAISEGFSDLLGSSDPAETARSATNVNDSDDSGTSELAELAESIAGRVADLLRNAGIGFAGPLRIELSPLENVYVQGESLESAEIERILDSDPGLRTLLDRWANSSGSRAIEIRPPAADSLT